MEVDLKAAAAEFVAMTLFVFIGCGSVVGAQEGVSPVPATRHDIAMAFGMGILVLAYAVAPFSGGQINCAVTLGLVILGECTPAQGLANFLAQMIGSVFGATLVYSISHHLYNRADYTGYPTASDFTLGANSVNTVDLASGTDHPAFGIGNAFIVEFMGTFLLMFVVCTTALYKKNAAGNNGCIAIGFAVYLAHVVCIPISGCGINPTRSFGPSLIANSWDDHWIYWIAPLLGSSCAAALYKFVFQNYSPEINVEAIPTTAVVHVK